MRTDSQHQGPKGKTLEQKNKAIYTDLEVMEGSNTCKISIYPKHPRADVSDRKGDKEGRLWEMIWRELGEMRVD